VLFNSNMLGRVDIFCVVARLPEPPVGLKAERAADGVKLTWQASKHHMETAGYYVYRSDKSGVDFTCITPRPVAATDFTDPAGAQGTFFYAVTAVENSGLEGGLSEEASAGPADAAKRRVFIEAESGARTGEMWIAFEGTASDLHYVWMRKKDGTGKVTIPVTLPKMTGACTVWARVKGEKGAEFSVAAGGVIASLKSPASAAWTWVKSDAVQMLAGKQDLVLSSSVYGSAIDRLCITDDAGFSPAQSPRVKWAEPPAVADVRAEVMSPYAVKVTWKDVRSDAFHHYNVYEGAVPTQPALIASVDRSEFIDWGLKPDSGLVYCVTAVDRAGNESKPSLAPLVRTPKVETVVVEKDGAASVEFEAPADGTYAVWLRMKKGERPANYCTVKVDNAGGGTWTCSWDGLGDDSWFSYDGWGRFDLKAGKHTLTIDNKTGNVIEKVLVTNNLWTRPAGHVNILGGW
jgi:fibronectin type 3 domain-containing protein